MVIGVEPLGNGASTDFHHRPFGCGFDSLHIDIARHTIPDQAVYFGRRFRRDDGLESFFLLRHREVARIAYLVAYLDQFLNQFAKPLVFLNLNTGLIFRSSRNGSASRLTVHLSGQLKVRPVPRPLCTMATGFAAFAELSGQGSLAKISDFGQLTKNVGAMLQKGFQVLGGSHDTPCM